MSILYVVSEVGWEYDDNNYYSIDGVFPAKAFKSKEKAKEELYNMSLRKFKSNFYEIRNYGYEDYERFDADLAEKSKIFEKLFEASLEDWVQNTEVDFVVQPTDQDWKDLYDCYNGSWYSIAEIELEE